MAVLAIDVSSLNTKSWGLDHSHISVVAVVYAVCSQHDRVGSLLDTFSPQL